MEKEKEIEGKRNALSKIKFGLSRHDRRLLQLYFGYIGLENGRQATKSKEDACVFVKAALFHEGDDSSDQPFSLEDEIDWKTFNELAGIFTKDRTDIQTFLTSEGSLTDIEECAIIRSHQSFGRAMPEDLLIGNRNSYLIILLLGKVSTTNLLLVMVPPFRPQRARTVVEIGLLEFVGGLSPESPT